MHLVSYVLRRLRINKLKINIVIFGIQPYADQFLLSLTCVAGDQYIFVMVMEIYFSTREMLDAK